MVASSFKGAYATGDDDGEWCYWGCVHGHTAKVSATDSDWIGPEGVILTTQWFAAPPEKHADDTDWLDGLAIALCGIAIAVVAAFPSWPLAWATFWGILGTYRVTQMWVDEREAVEARGGV